jgi:hypothetical protein
MYTKWPWVDAPWLQSTSRDIQHFLQFYANYAPNCRSVARRLFHTKTLATIRLQQKERSLDICSAFEQHISGMNKRDVSWPTLRHLDHSDVGCGMLSAC